MVASTVGHTIGAMRGAEQLSADALQGKADMRQVVDAVMSAEQSFQAAVAIRDKIVTAYLEVSRMAI
jgi:flagellar hook-basal body complex protein FliE